MKTSELEQLPAAAEPLGKVQTGLLNSNRHF